MPKKDDGRRLRAEAVAHYDAGRYLEAVQTQIEAVNLGGTAPEQQLDDHLRLSLYMFTLGDYPSAAKVLDRARELAPEDARVLENLGVVLKRLGRLAEAAEVLEAAVQLTPENANVHDALAGVHGRMGESEKARAHGARSLAIKDRLASARGTVHPLPETPPPEFRPDRPEQNIISFSLWGEGAEYLEGALRNARLAPDIYPGWRCRFHCDDTVPATVLDRLRELGAEVRMMARPERPFDGLFWRFQVMDDASVRRFLVRDCDAVINLKERVAVDDWLASKRYFHVMRDFYSHTELILAGMWGGVAGVLPSLGDLRRDFRPGVMPTGTIDQVFLRLALWPTVRQSCLVHDSWFDLPGTCDFPPLGRLPPGRHVGQNEHVVLAAARKAGTESP